jgi:hypothetical protein
LAVLSLGACSLSISGPKPNRSKLEAPSCDTSKGLVALDSLVAIGLGIGGLAALGDDSGTGAILLVGSALLTGAALHGSGNADKCRDAFADYVKETQAIARAAEQEVPRRQQKQRRDRDDDVEPDEDVQPDELPHVPMPAAHLRPPATQPPVAPAPASPPPQPKTPTNTDDWSQFWREVP